MALALPAWVTMPLGLWYLGTLPSESSSDGHVSIIGLVHRPELAAGISETWPYHPSASGTYRRVGRCHRHRHRSAQRRDGGGGATVAISAYPACHIPDFPRLGAVFSFQRCPNRPARVEIAFPHPQPG